MPVVEHLDVVEEAPVSFLPRHVPLEVHTLRLERVKERFHDRIVVAARSVTWHKRLRLILREEHLQHLACILTSPIGMENDCTRRSMSHQSAAERVADESGIDARAGCPQRCPGDEKERSGQDGVDHPSSLVLRGEMDGARLKIRGYDLHNQGKIRFSMASQKLHVDEAKFVGEGTDLTLSGDVPAPSAQGLNLKLSGNVNLKIADRLVEKLRVAGSAACGRAARSTRR